MVQGGVTTVIALLYALVPSVSSAYWILSVMTTQVYLIVYLLMFVAARQPAPQPARGRARLPAPVLAFLCVVGFLASAAAILIGFVPPSQFESGSAVAYGGLILAGTVLIGLLPPWLFLRFQKPDWKKAEADEPPGAAEPPPVSAAPDEGAAPTAAEPVAPEPPSAWHRWIRWAVAGVVLVLVVIGLITYSGKKETQEAQQKAQQLTQKLENAGLRVPQDQDILVRSLGDDGGAVCENPGNALGRAILYDQLTNGADFVGRRPVIADRDIVRGEVLILDTYCPDKLDEYQDKIDELKYDDTIEPDDASHHRAEKGTNVG